MSLGQALGGAVGLSTPATADFTSTREQLSSGAGGLISNLIQDPQQGATFRNLQQRTQNRIAQQQDQAENQLTSGLEKRGLQQSGIAAEGLQGIGQQALQTQAEAQRRLNELASQRQFKGLGLEKSLAESEAQAQNQQRQAEAQAQRQQGQALASTLSTVGGMFLSDTRLKKDIVETGETVARIPTIKFRWNEKADELGIAKPGVFKGVRASDVEELYPDLVTTHESGYKAVLLE